VRWTDIVGRVFDRLDPLSVGGRNYRETGSGNVTLFSGHASFVGLKTIVTGTGEIVTADQIVVAAGSRPVIPQQVLGSGVPRHTNDDIMRLPTQPRHLVILGSGYIAAEFAHVFSALGTKVSIVARKDGLLRNLDTDISTDSPHWHRRTGMYASIPTPRSRYRKTDRTAWHYPTEPAYWAMHCSSLSPAPPTVTASAHRPAESNSTTTAGSSSTNSDAPPPKVSTHSATCPPSSSSNTSPTTKPA